MGFSILAVAVNIANVLPTPNDINPMDIIPSKYKVFIGIFFILSPILLSNIIIIH